MNPPSSEPTTKASRSIAARWENFLLRFFSIPTNGQTMARAVEGARILIGISMLHRYIDILGAAVVAIDPVSAVRDAWAAAVIAFCVSIGLMTPLAVLAMMYFSYYTPFGFTLGDQMVTLVGWVLLFGGGGSRYSVDAWILRKPKFQRAMGGLYIFTLPEGLLSLAYLRFMVLFLFWSICLSAMSFHVQDPLWRSGNAMQLLLTLPYMSDTAAAAASFREHSPSLYNLLCTASLGVQSTFELLLIPLSLFRWGRVFVAFQWLGFIIIRAVSMNLGYLCLDELALWWFVYASGPLAASLAGKTAWSAATTTESSARKTVAQRLVSVFVPISVAVALYFNAVNFSTINFPGSSVARWSYPATVFRTFAQWPVNVFNHDDMAVGQLQLVIVETDANGKFIRVVPFQDVHGGRLSYLRNDLIYFGVSLRWQRTPREAQIKGAPIMALRIAFFDAALQAPKDRYYAAMLFSQGREPFHGYERWTKTEFRGGFRFALPAAVVKERVPADVPAFNLPPGHMGEGRRIAETEGAVRDLEKQGVLQKLQVLSFR